MMSVYTHRPKRQVENELKYALEGDADEEEEGILGVSLSKLSAVEEALGQNHKNNNETEKMRLVSGFMLNTTEDVCMRFPFMSKIQ